MVCLRNICVNTLHNGHSIFTNNNNNNNNNNNGWMGAAGNLVLTIAALQFQAVYLGLLDPKDDDNKIFLNVDN
jgi:hypothetical protein